MSAKFREPKARINFEREISRLRPSDRSRRRELVDKYRQMVARMIKCQAIAIVGTCTTTEWEVRLYRFITGHVICNQFAPRDAQRDQVQSELDQSKGPPDRTIEGIKFFLEKIENFLSTGMGAPDSTQKPARARAPRPAPRAGRRQCFWLKAKDPPVAW